LLETLNSEFHRGVPETPGNPSLHPWELLNFNLELLAVMEEITFSPVTQGMNPEEFNLEFAWLTKLGLKITNLFSS